MEKSVKRELNLDNRSGRDRRKNSGINLRSLFIGGRREHIRRHDDKSRSYFVDRYSPTLFLAIATILVLSIMDGLLTLILMERGAYEMNPIMAYYLELGPRAFMIVKYGLTSMGVVTILIFRNILLRGVKIYTGSLFYFIIGAFMSVVAWQFYLIFNVVN